MKIESVTTDRDSFRVVGTWKTVSRYVEAVTKKKDSKYKLHSLIAVRKGATLQSVAFFTAK